MAIFYAQNPSVFVLVTGILVFLLYYRNSKPKIQRDGKPLRCAPDSFPLLGHGLVFLRCRQKLLSWFVKCERQFGFETFLLSVPSLPPCVVVTNPKNVEWILKNEVLFSKGSFVKNRLWDLFGNGIINVDNELWKMQRKCGLKFFSKTNLENIMTLALPHYLSQTVEVLESSDDSTIDMNNIFHELTTQLMGRVAYNMEIHHSDPFSRAFDYASSVTAERFQNPLWKVSEFFRAKKVRDAISEVRSYGTFIVSNVMRERESDFTYEEKIKCFGSSCGTLIDSLINETNDKRIIADAALSYLTAGRDTTGQALSWTLYLLLKNPAHIRIAREQIEQTLKKNGSSGLGVRCLNTPLFRASSLPYIMAIFYESLRLFPPIPLEFKECQQPAILPDSTYLPKDTIICWCTWAMNRSRLIWGEDANDFRPERWIDNNNTFKPRSVFEFPVFNGGPRICLGKKMAESLAVQTISTLILRFDFELLDHQERISVNSLTLPMKDGFPCRVKIQESHDYV
ncbi:Cytochrome P450 94A1 [Golovinomyces cichoracearum]|uniref:Cytochrome P450 94A1 n=1 Tax=Golovinomyces cichoracearum TaxID=62708 RepID=A0A420I4A4_9PEZI|nr:Cytochrome P450 94A1 [Golovinomyces cichoracearum]